MNWLALLNKVKSIELKDVFLLALVSLAGYSTVQLDRARSEIVDLQGQVQTLKLVKESSELSDFANTVDSLLCEQAIKDRETKVKVVAAGTKVIRESKGPLLDEAVPANLVNTLNQTREEQLK